MSVMWDIWCVLWVINGQYQGYQVGIQVISNVLTFECIKLCMITHLTHSNFDSGALRLLRRENSSSKTTAAAIMSSPGLTGDPISLVLYQGSETGSRSCHSWHSRCQCSSYGREYFARIHTGRPCLYLIIIIAQLPKLKYAVIYAYNEIILYLACCAIQILLKDIEISQAVEAFSSQ